MYTNLPGARIEYCCKMPPGCESHRLIRGAGPVNPGRHLRAVPRARADFTVDPPKFCSYSGPCLRFSQETGPRICFEGDVGFNVGLPVHCLYSTR